MQLFSEPADCEAIEGVLADTLAKKRLAICGYCPVPNYWYFVDRPTKADEWARFFQRLTVTHATRRQRRRRRVGYDPFYHTISNPSDKP